MGYGLHLERLPPVAPDQRRAAYAKAAAATERRLVAESAESAEHRAEKKRLPPSAEQSRLAGLVRAHRNVQTTHESSSCIEMDAPDLAVQISIFEDTIGFSLRPSGFGPGKCVRSLRFVWECLAIFEREGFVAYDTQIDRVLDLANDFDAVLGCLCGARAVAEHRRLVVREANTYENQVAAAAKSGPAKPYSSDGRYAAGELVTHAKFGVGIVEAVASGRATIRFESGTKTLLCAS